MDLYNAAKIGNEFLTKAELSEYQKRIEERMGQNMQGLDPKSRKLVEDMAKGRALDEAIDRKVFSQLLGSAGFSPTSTSETKILANYFKRQFSEYMVDGKLDTVRLNEFLAQRRLSLEQIGKSMLKDYGPAKAFEMLQAATFASDFAVFDDARFASTRISLRILAIEPAAKDKLLRSRFNPSEAEIQTKFKAEFLSKDAKAVLDGPKRETIKATLFNDQRATLDKQFVQELGQASKGGIASLANAAGAKVISIDGADIASPLDSKKGKEFAAISLTPLAQSDIFLKQRLSAPIGQVVGPVDAGGFTFYFTVVDRKQPNLPTAAAYATLSGSGPDIFKKAEILSKEISYDSLLDAAAKGNYAQLLTGALEIQRSRTQILRYNQPAKPETGNN
jgi:hypothetical protein